jgi:hypothetical protein
MQSACEAHVKRMWVAWGWISRLNSACQRIPDPNWADKPELPGSTRFYTFLTPSDRILIIARPQTQPPSSRQETRKRGFKKL